MTRKCTICTHEQREAIEVDLLAGVSLRNITERFGTSIATLHRHKNNCIPSVMAKATDNIEIAIGDDLLIKIAGLERKAKTIGTKAEDKGDLKTALAAVRELTRIIELQARLAGEIKEHTINVLITSPDWLALRTRIMQALEQHPTAKQAVVLALTQAER